MSLVKMSPVEAMRQVTTNATRRALEEVAEAVRSTDHNEQVTRARVEGIEAVLGRGFWGRFKWLLRGK